MFFRPVNKMKIFEVGICQMPGLRKESNKKEYRLIAAALKGNPRPDEYAFGQGRFYRYFLQNWDAVIISGSCG